MHTAAEQIPFIHGHLACMPRLHVHLEQSFTYTNITGRVYTWKYNRPGADTHTQQDLFTNAHTQYVRFTHAYAACPILHINMQNAPFTHAHPAGPISAWSSSRPVYTCKTLRNCLHINTQQPPVCIFINSHMYVQQALFTFVQSAGPI